MANEWAERQWSRAPLGDKRLERRAIKIGEACLRSPDRTLPKKFGTWGDTKEAYRFFDSPSVTHEALQNVYSNCRGLRVPLVPGEHLVLHPP